MNMNGAHWHLIVNHVSLITYPIAAIALAFAMIRKSSELRVFAVGLFLVTGLFGYIADETGGGAAFVMRSVDATAGPFVHDHAEAADFAEGSALIAAALAIAMEVVARKKPNWLRALQWALLIVAIHGCTVFARVAYLGGLVRHTEIRAVSAGAASAATE